MLPHFRALQYSLSLYNACQKRRFGKGTRVNQGRSRWSIAQMKGLIACLLRALPAMPFAVAPACTASAENGNESLKSCNPIDHGGSIGALGLLGFRNQVEDMLRARPNNPRILFYNSNANIEAINTKDSHDGI